MPCASCGDAGWRNLAFGIAPAQSNRDWKSPQPLPGDRGVPGERLVKPPAFVYVTASGGTYATAAPSAGHLSVEWTAPHDSTSRETVVPPRPPTIQCRRAISVPRRIASAASVDELPVIPKPGTSRVV